MKVALSIYRQVSQSIHELSTYKGPSAFKGFLSLRTDAVGMVVVVLVVAACMVMKAEVGEANRKDERAVTASCMNGAILLLVMATLAMMRCVVTRGGDAAFVTQKRCF